MKAKANKPNWLEDAKKRAALEAVKHVKNNQVVGLGSGTTAAHAIQEIGKIIKQRNWTILGVPTSHQAFLLAIDCGIPTTTLNEHPKLDLTIDGVDEVNPNLDMIKGIGGASTREKIVASASKQNVIVADETKLVKKLGTNHPVPVEVIPFGAATTASRIKEIGAKPVLRQGTGKVGPVVTDNGNFILDVWTQQLEKPGEFHIQLKSIPGVVETGLFIGMADVVYVGTEIAVRRLSRR